MTKPVYRHLVEQKWRTRGDLDLLVRLSQLINEYLTHFELFVFSLPKMERIHQMNVVPDLLPTFHPSLDLRITFPEPPPLSTYLRTRVKRRHAAVEPGSYLLPEQVCLFIALSFLLMFMLLQTRRAPRLYTSVFHTETRLYTLVMIDAGTLSINDVRFCFAE